jgi:DNA-binding winged helix-turn-helix (wHTH) protein
VQYLFSDHTLDDARRELRRGAELIAIEPQVFDLLLYLLENRERVVSNDDLIASVWRGRIVSNSSLTSRINAARKAVGDSGEDQRVIRTIPRKGIRFIGAVRTQDAQPEHAAPSPEDDAHEPSRALPLRSRTISRTGSVRTSSPRCRSCAGST